MGFETTPNSPPGSSPEKEEGAIEKAKKLFGRDYVASLGTVGFENEATERARAIHEVANSGDPEAHDFIVSKIHDLNLRVRRAIYEEIANIGDAGDIEFLDNLKENDPRLSMDSAYIWDAMQKLRKKFSP